eukprot:2751118-Pleurochrysis_carterae.AAC.1
MASNATFFLLRGCAFATETESPRRFSSTDSCNKLYDAYIDIVLLVPLRTGVLFDLPFASHTYFFADTVITLHGVCQTTLTSEVVHSSYRPCILIIVNDANGVLLVHDPSTIFFYNYQTSHSHELSNFTELNHDEHMYIFTPIAMPYTVTT